jgi:ABC-2 type transport system permease protein
MKLFSVLKKDLLILLRDRAELALLFLMPLAFIIPISIALGSGDGYGIQSSNQMIPLPVANYDQGSQAQALMNTIGESLRLEIEYGLNTTQPLGLGEDASCAQPDPEMPVKDPACVEKVGRALILQSERSALLVIPEGFSDAITAGKPAQVRLLYDPAGSSIEFQQIQGVLRGAVTRLSLKNQVSGGMEQLTSLVALASDDVRQAVQSQAGAPAPRNQEPAISLTKTFPDEYRLVATPDTYQQTIPGYTIMFVFFIIISMSGSIRQERLLGTFRRLLSAPISRAELLGGKLLATMLVGLVQVLILFGVGAVAFKLSLGNDPLAFFLLTIALVAAAASIGLAASTVSLRGGALAVPLVVAALLGGCMFPLDLMPSFLRSLSYLVPHSWALAGYQNLMVRGQGLQEVFPQILVLAGFAALFFWIAVRRFRFETV